MAVSDPCYDRDSNLSKIRGILDNVKTGTWNAFTMNGKLNGWGPRIFELQVFHESCSPEHGDDSIWMSASEFEVGVDSGQAGFFDDEKYPYGDLGEYAESDSFYGRACELTLNESGGGILNGFGAVSCSGIGDGCYECYVLHDEKDEIIGAKIIFLEIDPEIDVENSDAQGF